MQTANKVQSKGLMNDITASIVVFLVALPLCLGIALASNAPLFAGLISGIIGGILVGILSGSATSVSGPAAGLTAVVIAQLAILGSFEAFLLSVVIAGFFQLLMGLFRLGFIANFFPSSVIKGLLAAIGLILILKQLPHLVGHSVDPMGDEAFFQFDNLNTFSELSAAAADIHIISAAIGFFSLLILIFWERLDFLKKSIIPSALIVVIFGVAVVIVLENFFVDSKITAQRLVQVPVANSGADFLSFFTLPDFSAISNPALYLSAATIALVASLETLLNLEAIEKLDDEKRGCSPSRELLAQGVGNVVSGLIGGLPITSVIVRSSVNINAGVRSKLSTILHGFFLLGSVYFVPHFLNKIPLSALAAILFYTGFKLISYDLVKKMYLEGKSQFLPFITTILAIVLSDLLTGVMIGLLVAIMFILHSSLKRPLYKTFEKHSTGENVLRIELPNQVSFLNRAALLEQLKKIPSDSNLLIDATNTDYIDPDILDVINDYKAGSKSTQFKLSLVGFKDKYPQLKDEINYVDLNVKQTQENLTSQQVIEILTEGNNRFQRGVKLKRDFSRILKATSNGQYPMAAVLSCIDSRTPVEIIFDLSMGDVFSIRVAGNVICKKVLGSLEFSTAVAGAKIILVMGHTSCGAVKAAVDLYIQQKTALETTGCVNLDALIDDIQKSLAHSGKTLADLSNLPQAEVAAFVDKIAEKNVYNMMDEICKRSSTISQLVEQKKVEIVGAMYDISTAKVTFL